MKSRALRRALAALVELHSRALLAGLVSLLPSLSIASTLVEPETGGGRQSNDQEQVSNEYRIKAAFLFNFAKYTTWPKEAFEKADSPIIVAVIGKDPFGADLDNTLANKTVGLRPIQVRRATSLQEAKRAHLLFLGELGAVERAALLQGLVGVPVLVVGEVAGLAKEGANANFFLENKKVRFEINVDAVKRAKLELSSELLKLARVIKEGKE